MIFPFIFLEDTWFIGKIQGEFLRFKKHFSD